uniref:Uncharacterized protein n=1 Tax=Cacopsylla melanoneura TaxID=428564 RepID=A0A8D8V5T2_9HEMI
MKSIKQRVYFLFDTKKRFISSTLVFSTLIKHEPENNLNRYEHDVRRRIALAKQAFMKKYNLLTNKHLTTETRKKFIKTFVWSVLLYGCETYTLNKNEKQRSEAMEMWMWRKMTRTSWIEKKSNDTSAERSERKKESNEIY